MVFHWKIEDTEQHTLGGSRITCFQKLQKIQLPLVNELLNSQNTTEDTHENGSEIFEQNPRAPDQSWRQSSRDAKFILLVTSIFVSWFSMFFWSNFGQGHGDLERILSLKITSISVCIICSEKRFYWCSKSLSAGISGFWEAGKWLKIACYSAGTERMEAVGIQQWQRASGQAR